jgi:putative ABC transport system permease protein
MVGWELHVLALDELWYRRGQFALIGLVVALVTYLVLMMNALGAGLLDQAGSAIKRLDADALVFRDNANLSLQLSELSQRTVDAIGAAPGVEASARLGYVSVQPSVKPERGPIAFIGFESGTISEPRVVAGRALRPGERGKVLADERFLDRRSARIGDTIEVSSRLRTYQFEIVGEVDEGAFFFQTPVWGSIDDWRDLRYGSVDANTPVATLVMIKGTSGIDATIGSDVPGTEGASLARTFDNIPGVGPQQNTANAIEGFGLVIGAMVVGVFFYVLTLQKVGQIGVLKAIGASSWFIFFQLTVQALLVAVIGLVVALPLTWLTVQALPGDVPLLLSRNGVVLSMILLLVTALVGVAFSGRKIASIDPLIALGQQQ